jgi:hypothetical protein
LPIPREQLALHPQTRQRPIGDAARAARAAARHRAYVWFFGAAILVQIALAPRSPRSLPKRDAGLRGKPVMQFLGDGSALVTAWLIALTFPSIAPWWLTVLGTLLAIVVAKHLYGGLGQNPFNPAMVAFALMIVAYPLADVAVAGGGLHRFCRAMAGHIRRPPTGCHHHGHAAGRAAHRPARPDATRR